MGPQSPTLLHPDLMLPGPSMDIPAMPVWETDAVNSLESENPSVCLLDWRTACDLRQQATTGSLARLPKLSES